MIYNKPNKQSIAQDKLTKLERKLNDIHRLMNNQDIFCLIRIKMVDGKRLFGIEASGNSADSLSYVNSLKKREGLDYIN